MFCKRDKDFGITIFPKLQYPSGNFGHALPLHECHRSRDDEVGSSSFLYNTIAITCLNKNIDLASSNESVTNPMNA